MLKFEINIGEIKSIYKNQIENDENFIANYAKKLNLFGSVVLCNFTSNDQLKGIFSVSECYLMMNSPNIKAVKAAIRMGVKKVIIPEKDVKYIGQMVSKKIIIARIRLREELLLDSSLKKIKDDLENVISRVSPYCSEILVDYNGEINTATLLGIIKILSSFKNISVTFLDLNRKNTKEMESKGINPLIRSYNLLEEKEMINIFTSVLDFQKQEDLIPTVVQDEHKQILMLAFSSQDSLTQALQQKRGIYFSRSRRSIWVKGETSGNYQTLHQARYDCDQDTMLFIVNQSGNACHLQRYSCFGDKEFTLLDLYDIIQDRILNPVANSYTSKISKDEKLIIKKIKEESNEVVNYTNDENLIWEIADLFYFITILMAKKEIKLQDILNELWSRRNYGN